MPIIVESAYTAQKSPQSTTPERLKLLRAACASPRLRLDLPPGLAALPPSHPRRKAAEAVVRRYNRTIDYRTRMAVEELLDARAHAARVAFLLERMPSPGEVGTVVGMLDHLGEDDETCASLCLDDLGVDSIEDLTPEQRWELVGEVFGLDGTDLGRVPTARRLMGVGESVAARAH